jgi:peptidoglycan/LPS O-acetylase OafA/YrhL
MSDPKIQVKENYIGVLDALRGFLAFWVFYGHVKMASIGKDVLWGSPAIAVDGFMLLSGFLMAYHWILREDKFKSFWRQTKDFYLRRFFRIAPLYYLLLTIGYVFQDRLFAIKGVVNSIVPPAWGGEVTAIDTAVARAISIKNIIAHFSFSFGLFPKYASSTILPDWSISLEMQFYLLFPLLVILITRFGSATITFLVFLLTIITNKFIGLHEHAGLFLRYPQPSMIFFKLNIFFTGIFFAYAFLTKDNKRKIGWLILGLISLYDSKIQVFIIALLLLLLLFFDEEGDELINKIGLSKLSRFIGDTSYAVYLLHIIVMYPILYILFQQDWYGSLAIYPRLLVSLLVITPVVYGLSYLIYWFIERRWILIGKGIASRSS